MYRNLIIGIDGRAGGQEAVALARQLAAPDARLTLVHVTAHSSQHLEAEPAVLEPDGLTGFGPELQACGRQASLLREVAGSVGVGLELAVERLAADLVVVGACGRKGLTRVFGGDDARATMRATSCALAVAPAGYRSRAHAIRRIGAACDGTAASRIAVAHAGLLAHELGAELSVLAVAEPHILTTPYGAFGKYAEQPGVEIRSWRERLDCLPEGEVRVVYGAARPKLEDLSREVDLLVCGSRRSGLRRRVLGGSTSAWLIGHAHCAVLIAPPEDPSVEPVSPHPAAAERLEDAPRRGRVGRNAR